MAAAALYDTIGRSYSTTRRPDPRIEAAIAAALGDASTIVNVGAGTGSYEPAQTVLAVEPSATMIAQRPAGASRAVRAAAEALPLRTNSVDAALGVLTLHHWTSLAAGLAELRRVARRRIVLLTWDADVVAKFWLLDEYLPAAAATDRAMAVPMSRVLEELPGAAVLPLPIPHDCRDGFGAAYWRRPERYLDPVTRAGMSMLAKTDPAQLAAGLQRLARDVETGAWHREHAELLTRDEFDLGYRLVVAPVSSGHLSQ